MEIPFAFNNLDKPSVDFFIGPGPLPQGVADCMHEHWAKFVRGEALNWPPYSSLDRHTMVFNDTSRVVANPNADCREAWDGLL